MQLENIRLEEAMNVDTVHNIRVWKTPGLHVEDEEVLGSYISAETIVMKCPNGDYVVRVDWVIAGDGQTCMKHVDKLSSLEELRKQYPHFFELTGNLHAFG